MERIVLKIGGSELDNAPFVDGLVETLRGLCGQQAVAMCHARLRGGLLAVGRVLVPARTVTAEDLAQFKADWRRWTTLPPDDAR